MKQYKPVLVWILIVAGILWGYEGVTGTNLLVSVLSAQVASIIMIIVGLVALVLAYLKLTMKKGK